MKHRKLVIAGITAALVLAAGAAFAFHGPGFGGRFMKPERMLKMLSWKVDDALEQVEATEEQRAVAHEVKLRLFEKGQALHEQHKGLREQMQAAWLQDSPDVEAMRALVDAQGEQMREFAYASIDAMAELHAVLSAEQRAKLAEILPGLGMGRGMGRGMGPDRGGSIDEAPGRGMGPGKGTRSGLGRGKGRGMGPCQQ